MAQSTPNFELDRFPPRHCEIVRRRFREEDVPDVDRSDEVRRELADLRRDRRERELMALGEQRRAASGGRGQSGDGEEEDDVLRKERAMLSESAKDRIALGILIGVTVSVLVGIGAVSFMLAGWAGPAAMAAFVGVMAAVGWACVRLDGQGKKL